MSEALEWRPPLTPWRLVQQKFFNTKGLDAKAFSCKHGLNERDVRMVLGEMVPDIFPDLCAALAKETGMTPEFFAGLNAQYHEHMSGRPR